MLPGDGCSNSNSCTSAITGLAFYDTGTYPALYNGALFFADYSRQAIWAMLPDANGLPNPANVTPFLTGAGSPVSLKIGPGGDLFYADITGTIYRVRYYTGNQPPIASILASPTSGAAPLMVSFDGTGSSDPDSDPLSYAWDLNGDGLYNDSTAAQPSYTYTQNGSYTTRLKVSDSHGASGSAETTISVGNTPPTAVIDTPAASLRWQVGETIAFTGHATDAEQGAMPAATLAWSIVLHHCYTPTDCHEHLVEELSGAGGSFTAPDHEDLPYIELRLTTTDAGGLSNTASVLLAPQTTTLALRSNPTGLAITLDSGEVTTPHEQTVVAGSEHTLIAPDVQAHRSFVSWTDANTQTVRTIPIGTTPTTYTATYANRPPVAQAGAMFSSAAPLKVAFSAAGSSDPEGDSLTYLWAFGDGATATTPNPTHTYATPGTRQVTLTVTDAPGAANSVSISVDVTSDGRRKVWLPRVTR